MAEIPTIRLQRGLLTPFESTDAPLVEKYAGDPEVAAMTKNIPHPYPSGGSVGWIESHAALFLAGTNVVFAIRKPDGSLIGCINIRTVAEHRRGDLGYWIGKPFWNQGHATEAVQAVLAHAFKALGLNKVYAQHLAFNPASGRVMQKNGMVREGMQREHYFKGGKFVDVVEYSILKSEYDRRRACPDR